MNMNVTRKVVLEIKTDTQEDVDILRGMAHLAVGYIIKNMAVPHDIVEFQLPNGGGKIQVDLMKIKSYAESLMIAGKS